MLHGTQLLRLGNGEDTQKTRSTLDSGVGPFLLKQLQGCLTITDMLIS